jgi:hypothetical protein
VRGHAAHLFAPSGREKSHFPQQKAGNIFQKYWKKYLHS